ncbi:MAG: hypothetical protein ONB24_12810 [candidate division KSB1 bacterium]|nr:hypothetical protein [candidate division KSB1 bacterium]
MKSILPLAAAVLLLSCSNPCEISEKYDISTSHFVYDKGFNKYAYKFTFLQKVEVWSGKCSGDKNKNETYLSLTSFAPCDQEVNFTITVNQGAYTYQFSRNKVKIRSQETIDFGLIQEGGGRINNAAVDIALYCPLCPQDNP